MKKLLINLVLLFILSSCNQVQPCLENVQPKIVFGFKKMNDSLQEKDTILNYPLMQLGNIGYYGLKSTRLVTDIPSNVSQSEFEFVSDTTNPIQDIITIKYTPKLHFISKECGFQYFFTVNEVNSTKNNIKKIRIIDSNINDQVQNPHIIITL